uniref:Diphthine--ammonia ligase n=1 Tax=Cyprinus carpio TaxID=7962 RepID=A0A8C2JHZ0_CYPCA
MRVAALIMCVCVCGGTDSCCNMLQCVSAGHSIVALVNLMPHTHDLNILSGATGIDSQSAGIVSDLVMVLQEKERVEAVSFGAILSDYQRIRVENVCVRLQLQLQVYLWCRDQAELLREIIILSGLQGLLIKVAVYGLDPQRRLGKSLAEMEPYLHEGSGGRPLPLSRCPCQNAIDRMTDELEYAAKTLDVQGGCPSNAERSCQSEPGEMCVCWISGLSVLQSETPRHPEPNPAHLHTPLLSFLSFCLLMEHINSVYCTYFTHSHPARVCVQVWLPVSQQLRMDVLLQDRTAACEEDAFPQIDTLHVQSLSHWTPANIGPTVQLCRCSERSFIYSITFKSNFPQHCPFALYRDDWYDCSACDRSIC